MSLLRLYPSITLTYEDQDEVVIELEVITDVDLLNEPENTREVSEEFQLIVDGLPDDATEELEEEHGELMGKVWEEDQKWMNAIEESFLIDDELRDKLITEGRVRQIFPVWEESQEVESEIRLVELTGNYDKNKLWKGSKYSSGFGLTLMREGKDRVPNLVESYEDPGGEKHKFKLIVTISYDDQKDVVLNIEYITDQYDSELVNQEEEDNMMGDFIGIEIESRLEELLSKERIWKKHGRRIIPREETEHLIREEQVYKGYEEEWKLIDVDGDLDKDKEWKDVVVKILSAEKID